MSTSETTTARPKARVIEGVVVSDKMNKTRIIVIKRNVQHGLYGKGLVKGSRFFVHDETNQSKLGDRIQAVATRPLSKHKTFRLIKVLNERAAL